MNPSIAGNWPRLTGRAIRTLLLALAVLVPLGDIGRLGRSTHDGAEPGLTTLITVVIIGLGLAGGHCLNAVRRYPALLLLLLFITLGVFASLGVSDDGAAVSMSIRMIGYALVAAAVIGVGMHADDVARTVGWFALSSALVAVLSLIDYFLWLDVPVINDRLVYREIGPNSIRSVTGPFYSQTTVAANVAMALPIALCLALQRSVSALNRLGWAAAVFALSLVGILTYSRGLVLSSFVAGVYVLVQVTRPFRPGQLARLAAIVILAGASMRVVAPELLSAFLVRAELIRPQHVVESEHDMLRLYAAQATLSDVSRAPLGAGFTNPSITAFGEVNVHSNFTFALRAGGALGIFFLLVFFAPLAAHALRAGAPRIELAVFASLASFGTYGLAHTTIGFVFGWVLLGIAASVRASASERSLSPVQG